MSRFATIKEAQEALEKRQVTSEELTRECLTTIEEKDKEIHAFLEVFDDALAQAKAADARRAAGEKGPLLGIPLALKDNICVTGKIASAASRILANHVSVYDATATAKLKAAGAVIIGRTNLDEFAMGSSTENSAFGPTKNPHDTTRVAGGTSGGSTAAVAAGMCYAALGSDTGGSIRQPAALCGVVGLKPTYGSVSRHGLIALASSLDVIGPITRSVEDAEMVYRVIAGKDPMDATSVDASDYDPVTSEVITIGVPRTFLKEYKLRPEIEAVFQSALQRLQDLGHTLIDIELPNFGYSIPTYYVVLPAEASANLARFDGMRYGLHTDGADIIDDYGKTRGAGFGPEPRRRIILGTYVLSSGYYDAYYNKANTVRALIVKDFADALTKCDVIAMPTSTGPAFKLGEKVNDPVQMYLEDLFTGAANLTHLPAISIPDGTVNVEGKDLPLGLQLIAPHMGEARLIAVGKKFLGEA